MRAGYEVAHLLGGLILALSFAQLARRRASALVTLCGLQAAILAAAAAWQAWIQASPGLYLTALATLLVNAVAMPILLRRRLDPLGDAGRGMGLFPTLALGLALLVLAALAVPPATLSVPSAPREALAVAVSVVLLGLLMMVSRRTQLGQALGLLSLEHGLILAAIGVSGMPMLVGISLAAVALAAVPVLAVPSPGARA